MNDKNYADPQDTPKDILNKFFANRPNLQDGSFFTRSNLSQYVTVVLEGRQEYSMGRLEALIEHAQTGGTFGFGHNRTFETLQQAGYLDLDGNPTKTSPVFFNAWNKIVNPSKDHDTYQGVSYNR